MKKLNNSVWCSIYTIQSAGVPRMIKSIRLRKFNAILVYFPYPVSCSKYSIDREDCGKYLGFEVVKVED